MRSKPAYLLYKEASPGLINFGSGLARCALQSKAGWAEYLIAKKKKSFLFQSCVLL
jgi:hypothetical protein